MWKLKAEIVDLVCAAFVKVKRSNQSFPLRTMELQCFLPDKQNVSVPHNVIGWCACLWGKSSQKSEKSNNFLLLYRGVEATASLGRVWVSCHEWVNPAMKAFIMFLHSFITVFVCNLSPFCVFFTTFICQRTISFLSMFFRGFRKSVFSWIVTFFCDLYCKFMDNQNILTSKRQNSQRKRLSSYQLYVHHNHSQTSTLHESGSNLIQSSLPKKMTCPGPLMVFTPSALFTLEKGVTKTCFKRMFHPRRYDVSATASYTGRARQTSLSLSLCLSFAGVREWRLSKMPLCSPALTITNNRPPGACSAPGGRLLVNCGEPEGSTSSDTHTHTHTHSLWSHNRWW